MSITRRPTCTLLWALVVGMAERYVSDGEVRRDRTRTPWSAKVPWGTKEGAATLAAHHGGGAVQVSRESVEGFEPKGRAGSADPKERRFTPEDVGGGPEIHRKREKAGGLLGLGLRNRRGGGDGLEFGVLVGRLAGIRFAATGEGPVRETCGRDLSPGEGGEGTDGARRGPPPSKGRASRRGATIGGEGSIDKRGGSASFARGGGGGGDPRRSFPSKLPGVVAARSEAKD